MVRNPMLSEPFSSKKTIKRKPVRASDRRHLLEFQKGKCKKCKKSFKIMGVRPVLHHVNHNRSDNKIVNMILVCSNCHDKIHQKDKKVRKKVKTAWGGTEVRTIRVKTTTKKKVKKTTKKKPKKKTSRKPKTDMFGNIIRKQPIKFKF
ncbi:MAG: hypothetical protein KJ906_03450 [Nanoarchaeota archaeon]|nr:hypothetical protein [Nanoarchaeota archaeon]